MLPLIKFYVYSYIVLFDVSLYYFICPHYVTEYLFSFLCGGLCRGMHDTSCFPRSKRGLTWPQFSLSSFATLSQCFLTSHLCCNPLPLSSLLSLLFVVESWSSKREDVLNTLLCASRKTPKGPVKKTNRRLLFLRAYFFMCDSVCTPDRS